MKILITENQLNRILLKEATLGAPLGGKLHINSKFGPRWGRMHNGVDYHAKVGTPVRSISDGVIRTAKFQGPRGKCGGTIIIKHDNGFRSSYCHMSVINLLGKEGERVSKGEVIGRTGGAAGAPGAGNSQGPHLHFGLKKGGKWVDPENFVSKTVSDDLVTPAIGEGIITLWDGMGPGRKEMRDMVREMQSALIARNYILPKFGIDGKFGRETLAAVNAFQKDYGLEITDMITPEVLTAMKDPTKINLNPQENDPTTVKKLEDKGIIEPDANFILPLKGRKYEGNQQITSNDVVKFFVNKGLKPWQAAGIAGNMKSESNFKTGTIGDGGTSMGLAQWHDNRLYRLNDFAKQADQPITNPDVQLKYLMSELEGREKRAYAALKATTTAPEAGVSFMKNFERPGNQSYANQRKRGRQAQDALDTYLDTYPA